MPFVSMSGFRGMPALGPLVEGHSMIVSEKHAPSLLTMSEVHKSNFLELSNHMARLWDGAALTFAEHGSAKDSGSGPCICHTHVNVIPGVPPESLNLEARGHNLIAEGGLLALPAIEDSYFLVGQGEYWRVYGHSGAPSQHLRMILFETFGLLHWDWRTLPNEELAARTYDRWTSCLGLEN